MEKHAKPHMKLSFYKWFLRNRKKKTYEKRNLEKGHNFFDDFLELSPQRDF
jgi:uncharacterized protein YozE (UPF0346 family)